ALGNGFLAVEHDAVHELGKNDIPELRIGQDFPLLGATTTSHWLNPSLKGLILLRALGAVLGTALPAVLDALGVKHAAQDVVAHTGKVAHAAAPDQHHGVLLKVVAF